MRSIDKIFFAEKITTINLTKIIHRVIISIDSRVSHTIIIIAALIVINSAPRLHITSSPFYPTNSRRKSVI
jgi:uncharacterized membrane protein YcaP (DUF421 family)